MKGLSDIARSLVNIGCSTIIWQASVASETLSGLFNRESRIYIYLIVRANFVLITRKEGGAYLKLLPELFVYVYVALRRALAVKIPLPRQHFSSRILFDRKLSESYFF